MKRRYNSLGRFGFVGMVALASLTIERAGAVPLTSITVGSVVATQGSSETLEIDLTNLGGAPVNIASFSFGITVGGATGITFTGADFSSISPYIFASDSFDVNNSVSFTFGPALPGPILQAADFSDSGLGNDLASGATVSLGRVSFLVSVAAALGPNAITLSGAPVTSLIDSLGNDVTFSGVDGTITVTAASIPEPSSIVLGIGGLVVLLAKRVGQAGCLRRVG
jgi:hypothetical protein